MKRLLFTITLLLAGTALYAQTLGYAAFRTPAQMTTAMNNLVSAYPSRASQQTIGTTHEGRAIRALKIETSPAAAGKGDVVFIGLHHAREWLSAEASLYTADRLLHRYATDAALQADMNNLRIWIIPALNQDGYAHTWSAGGNPLPLNMSNPRYWRKNRKPNGDGSFGVDPNRNYGYQWGIVNNAYNSANPFDHTYYGPAGFSERETQAIRDFLAGLQNLKCVITHHTFSELYLKPWSYTNTNAPGYQTLASVQQRNINRIQAVHGHTYTTSIWYNSIGECTDYIWNQHRAAAFTPELRPSQLVTNDLDGFAPAASEILPTCEENFAANRAIVHDAARTGLWIKDNAADGGEEPFTAGAFWVSPDIWTVPATLNQGDVVQLNVRVRNNTGVAQNGATLEVYYTDPRIMLEFPNPNAILIGTRTINVPAGGATEVFNWTVPNGTNSWGELHWCVGAVIKHADDMPLTTIINRSSNIACRNFNTEPMGIAAGALTFVAENILGTAAEVELKIDEQLLPAGVRVQAEEGWMRNDSLSAGSVRKARLLNVKGAVLEPGQKRYIKIRIIGRPTDPNIRETDIAIGGNLLPLVAGKREAVGNGFTYRIKWE
jgi:carboxypeptidase T